MISIACAHLIPPPETLFMNQPIIITETDAKELRSLLQRKTALDTTFAESVCRLKNELERAVIVQESELPEDVIALNSTVELEDLVDREVQTFRLVLPEYADFSEGRISKIGRAH